MLELARTDYKKVVQENNLLKHQLLGLKSTQLKRKKPIKRKYVTEESDSETDSELESDTESEEEQKGKIEDKSKYPEVNIKKNKETNKRNINRKQKLFDYINKKDAA